MIRLEGVTFGYSPERAVLEDLSFEVARGELLGVIGPNGAGKSTLLRLLHGSIRPSRGRIELEGRAIESYPRGELARRLASVAQDESTDFPFTALEVVLMGRISHLGALGFERRSDLEAARAAMRLTEVEHLSDRPLHALSGGERKRVLLARAFAQGSQTLVLDEPAAALDIHHQIAIFDLLRERHRSGSTVIAVVHDLNLAAAYCSRVLLLQRGRPAQIGTVEEVLTYGRVKQAFGVEVYVGVNELSGARFLIPMSSTNKTA